MKYIQERVVWGYNMELGRASVALRDVGVRERNHLHGQRLRNPLYRGLGLRILQGSKKNRESES